MLTKELAIFEFEGERIKPDRLTRKSHGHYLAYAGQMLRVYAEGIGRTRHELHGAIRQIFADEPDCPPARIEAFCKLLDEARISEYETDRRGKAAGLRSRVFRLAAPHHPLVVCKEQLFDHGEQETKQAIAGALGRPSWQSIEAELFADVLEFNRLMSFAGYPDAEALLSRYNVAQTQAALFYATRLVIRARSDFQRIATHAKLARLLHNIIPPPGGVAGGEYTFILDGPASVLRETRRYGYNLARFLPALLSCRDWRMEAEILFKPYGRKARLALSSASGLKSEMPPPDEFDSSVEETFARKWGEESRNGWSLKREAAILQRKQTAFVPDFALRHEDGRNALLEIVGFWTPEYLQAKIEKLKLFAQEHIILAVAEGVARKWENPPQNMVLYKTALKLNDVLAALEQNAPKGS